MAGLCPAAGSVREAGGCGAGCWGVAVICGEPAGGARGARCRAPGSLSSQHTGRKAAGQRESRRCRLPGAIHTCLGSPWPSEALRDGKPTAPPRTAASHLGQGSVHLFFTPSDVRPSPAMVAGGAWHGWVVWWLAGGLGARRFLWTLWGSESVVLPLLLPGCWG